MGSIIKTLAFSLVIMLALSSFGLLIVKLANAQDITKGSPTSDERTPFITIKMADGTTIENNFSQQASQPLNLSLAELANSSPNGLIYGVLTVSYVASCLNTQVVLYSWSGNPTNFNDWFTNNSNINPNVNTHLGWYNRYQTPEGTNIYSTKGPPNWVDYNLVLNDIPLGHQQINFTIVKAALYGYGPFSYAEMVGNKTIDFTVTDKPYPTSTLVPEFPALIIMPLLLSLFSIAVIIKLRNRKNIFQNNLTCREKSIT